jgi:gluconate 2-dehydrogenase alpha chain
MRSTTIEKYGEEALPAGSAIADWPLTYDDLEPCYDQVEYLIGVSGQGGGNPFESPRARDYPMPPLRRRGFTDLARDAMESLGYHPFDGPAAIASEEYTGRPACSYCGFCTGFGCWNSAKSSTLVTAIPEAEATGNFEVRANSRVVKLLSDDTGKMTGVEYIDENGETQEQPAGVVIVASYVYENVRLMLVSTSEFFPDGLANNAGQVGKYYIAHAYASANGLFPGEQLNLFSGSGAQGISMDDFNGDNFDHTELGFIRGALISCGAESLPIGQSRAVPPGAPQWGSAYKAYLNENAQAIGAVSAQVEILPYEGNFIDLDPDVTDPSGMPVARLTFSHRENEELLGAYITERLEEILKEMGAAETWSFPMGTFPINTHAYGGTRMGDDPATSVVDRYSIAHESPNLVVLGGSTFPNTTGYNPTETIQALAWFAADNLARNFQTIAG